MRLACLTFLFDAAHIAVDRAESQMGGEGAPSDGQSLTKTGNIAKEKRIRTHVHHKEGVAIGNVFLCRRWLDAHRL